MPRRDAITLHGIRLHPRVGVRPHEASLARPLQIELTVWLGAARAAAALDRRERHDFATETGDHGPLGCPRHFPELALEWEIRQARATRAWVRAQAARSTARRTRLRGRAA